ncbi:unnamed protein product [Adineta steineri]|uniref:G-protein coupled receptors family 1 profile domain-containing protein n=1 Tax=Adineta steineri TaxID=433720 RepID=A0A814LU93_9BILA|nr:unnamed protein product [Adineta steineri]CAF4023865.1 unnamed protein product [Adineta steineri]
MISMNVRTILGDLYEQSFKSSWCLFSGYVAIVNFSILYLTFINQSLHCLVQTVYSQYRWIQSLTFYTILPVLELIGACVILLCPLIPFNSVIYLEYDHYCYISFSNIGAILWAAFVCYIIPFCCLLIMYIRIVVFLRHQPNNQTLAVRHRQNRNLMVIRRILMLVNLLLILGLPSIVLIGMIIVTGEQYPLTNRIGLLPVSISMSGLSVALIYCISPLKSIALKLRQSNRVLPN